MRVIVRGLSLLILLLGSVSATHAEGTINWQGFYVGAHVGGGRTSSDTTSTFENLSLRPVEVDLTDTSFLGGAQAGYLWQLHPSFVVGIEGDFSFMNSDDTGSDEIFDTFGTGVLIFPNTTLDLQWLSSVRGRVGYASGPLLIYGTGGVAWAKVSMMGEINRLTPNGPGFLGNFFDASDSKIANGWVAGGGAEYQFSPNWIIGAEYLHYNLGEETLSSSRLPGNLFMSYKFDTKVNVGRVTAKYKF